MVLVDEVDFLESSVYLDATTLPRRSSQPTLRVAPGRKRRPGTMAPLHALRHSASMPEIRNPLPATPAALEPNRQSAALAPGPAPAESNHGAKGKKKHGIKGDDASSAALPSSLLSSTALFAVI